MSAVSLKLSSRDLPGPNCTDLQAGLADGLGAVKARRCCSRLLRQASRANNPVHFDGLGAHQKIKRVAMLRRLQRRRMLHLLAF